MAKNENNTVGLISQNPKVNELIKTNEQIFYKLKIWYSTDLFKTT
jgi:hypothetical protein